MILSTTWDSPGIVKCFNSFLIPSSIIMLPKSINLMNSSLIFCYISSYPPIKTPIFEKLSLAMLSCMNWATARGLFSMYFSLKRALMTLKGFYALLNLSIAFLSLFLLDFLSPYSFYSSAVKVFCIFLICSKMITKSSNTIFLM